MARISFFEVSGLAGRRGTVKNALRDDINVIWGANGSGKTALLKILHSALLDDATPILRVPFTRAKVGIVSGPGNIEYIRTIAKEDAGRSDVSDYTVDPVAEYQDELRRLIMKEMSERESGSSMNWKTEPVPPARIDRFSHGYLPISRISEARGRQRRRTRTVSELVDEAAFDRLFAEQITSLWSEYNQRALIRIRTAQDRALARIIGLVLATEGARKESTPVADAEAAYETVREFFSNQRLGAMLRLSSEDFMRNYDSNIIAQQVVSEVVDVQRDISRVQEPQREIERLLGRLYGGKKRVELRGGEVVVLSGKNPIPLESLSSGEKQLLQLLLECMAAGSNPVLIDEPELSLHVDWQNQLIRNMRVVNGSAQLVMATHSPEVMANLDDHHLIEL